MTPTRKRGVRFVKAFTSILRDSRIKPVDKCVLWAIKSYSNADGYCIPSVATICVDLGISRDTVHDALNRLEKIGILKRQPRVERGNRTSNFYLFMDEHFAKHCAKRGCREKPTSTLSEKSDTSKTQKEEIPPNVVPIRQAV